MNHVLMNMGWALKKGDNSLWAKVLKSKYGRDGMTDNSLIVKNTDSFIWKALAKFWPMFSETEMWSINNGSIVNAWKGRWLDDKCILSEFAPNLPFHMQNFCVADLVDGEGDWN